MTSLIAFLSSGKGTWGHVQKVVEGEEWEKVFLITDDFGKEKFKSGKEIEFVVINKDKFLSEISSQIYDSLKGKINDIEVGVNIISGTGKEHMALISALMKLGLGIRLVALTPEGVKEF